MTASEKMTLVACVYYVVAAVFGKLRHFSDSRFSPYSSTPIYRR